MRSEREKGGKEIEEGGGMEGTIWSRNKSERGPTRVKRGKRYRRARWRVYEEATVSRGRNDRVYDSASLLLIPGGIHIRSFTQREDKSPLILQSGVVSNDIAIGSNRFDARVKVQWQFGIELR